MALIALLEYLHEHNFILLVVAVVFWFSLYFLLCFSFENWAKTKCLPKLTQLYIIEAWVSAVQGFVCGGIGFIGVLRCRHDVMGAQYQAVVFYCTFGAGYFIYDMVAMFRSNYLSRHLAGKSLALIDLIKSYLLNHALMIAHHIILISVLFPALITYSGMGHFFAGNFFVMELSSPLVNARIVLSRLNMKRTKLYVLNGVTMMIVFAFCRVFIFPYMYLTYMFQISHLKNISLFRAFSTIPGICHFSCVIILAPQLYWLSLMVKGVAAVVMRYTRGVQKID